MNPRAYLFDRTGLLDPGAAQEYLQTLVNTNPRNSFDLEERWNNVLALLGDHIGTLQENAYAVLVLDLYRAYVAYYAGYKHDIGHYSEAHQLISSALAMHNNPGADKQFLNYCEAIMSSSLQNQGQPGLPQGMLGELVGTTPSKTTLLELKQFVASQRRERKLP